MNKNVMNLIVVGLALGVVALVCLVGLVRHDQEEPLGGEILWDDFGFSVLSQRTAEEVGPPDGRVHARGEFRIVRLQVTNHAKRVDYDLGKHRVVLEDENNRRFVCDERGTRALLRESGVVHPDSIHAGATDVRELAFDVPKDARNLRLRIVWGGAIIDGIDKTIFGDRVFVLP